MSMKFQIDANDRWDLSNPDERRQAARSCLRNADDFASFAGTAFSAVIIKSAVPNLPKPIDIDEYAYAKAPMYVNLLLAVELYLKALLLSKEPDKEWTDDDIKALRIHEIEDLFNALEDYERVAIFELFVPCHTAKSREEFDLSIKEVSKGFVCLRYQHEMKGFSVTAIFIYNLTTAVANYVTDIFEGESNGA